MSDKPKKKMPWLGGTHSQETKDKISATLKKYEATEEHCVNLSKSRTGKKHSDETKEKIRVSLVGNVIAEDTRHKLSIVNTGRIPTSEQKMKQLANTPRGEDSHFWNGELRKKVIPTISIHRLRKRCVYVMGEVVYIVGWKKIVERAIECTSHRL